MVTSEIARLTTARKPSTGLLWEDLQVSITVLFLRNTPFVLLFSMKGI
jgi:hypothetical protein